MVEQKKGESGVKNIKNVTYPTVQDFGTEEEDEIAEARHGRMESVTGDSINRFGIFQRSRILARWSERALGGKIRDWYSVHRK